MSGVNSRRGLLAAAAAVAVPGPAEAATDPHPAWWATVQRLRAAAQNLGDDEADVLFTRVDQLLRRIALTPARTAADIRVQIVQALHDLETDTRFDLLVRAMPKKVEIHAHLA
jgi:hypothetical protein